jgi:purine-binding chemotaxis protein CheW
MAPDKTRRLERLRQRAAALAARRSAAPQRPLEAFLAFRLGQERYAISLGAISQVAPLDHLVPVSGAPPQILGIMTLRGEVGTVWSLARVLGLPPAESAPGGHVLVLKASSEVGLRVDEVDGTRDLDASALLGAGGGEVTLPLRLLRGLTADGTHVLDAEAVRLEILANVARLTTREHP